MPSKLYPKPLLFTSLLLLMCASLQAAKRSKTDQKITHIEKETKRMLINIHAELDRIYDRIEVLENDKEELLEQVDMSKELMTKMSDQHSLHAQRLSSFSLDMQAFLQDEFFEKNSIHLSNKSNPEKIKKISNALPLYLMLFCTHLLEKETKESKSKHAQE